MEYKRVIKLIIAGLLIGGAIYVLESRKTERPLSLGDTDAIDVAEVASENTSTESAEDGAQARAREERIREKSKKFSVAKEISTPDGFINTDGITVSELIGKKIVLIDFWTYSCINCQRTLPYLNSWYAKYKDQGLVILGIHTPEFEFEKDYNNVQRAVEKFGVQYPVILDNDYSTWTAYKNRYWPRKYFIDIDGFIVYDHIGEGGYEETEQKIVELLNERSAALEEDAVLMNDQVPVGIDEVNFLKVRTPETYLGYKRLAYLANLPSRSCYDSECEYVKPGSIKLNTYALAGIWNIGAESARLVSGSGEIIVRFSAKKVNLVAGISSGSVQAQILLDGQPINVALHGGTAVAEGGTVIFSTHDLYNLVDLRDEYGEHELIIRILNAGLEAFAFTFG